MVWKVINISSGLMIKAGFANEDDAQSWLEAREELENENFLVEEMDPDEEEEWNARSQDEDEDPDDYLQEDHGDDLDFGIEDVDYDADEGLFSEIDPDEDDV